jgi:predicted RNA methylase
MPALVRIPDHVEAILRRAKATGCNLVISEQLDRKVYEETNKIIVMLGGKWNRSAKAHVFPKPIAEVLAEALDSGEVLNKKVAQQAFYTPEETAKLFVALVEADCRHKQGPDPLCHMRILEPSAGHGALVRELLDRGARVTAVDNDPEAVEELLKISSDRLQVLHRDFLDWTPPMIKGCAPFAAVVMNPPFTKGQDAKHVMKALECVAHNGAVYAIMPGGWEKDTGHHKKLKEMSSYFCMQELEAGTFKGSGTMVRTEIVRFIRKS